MAREVATDQRLRGAKKPSEKYSALCMYVCMYVCVCAYIYIYIHIYEKYMSKIIYNHIYVKNIQYNKICNWKIFSPMYVYIYTHIGEKQYIIHICEKHIYEKKAK